jgi:hypothetical protein
MANCTPHAFPLMVQRSAERLSPAAGEEFRGDGLEIGELERLFQKHGVNAQRLDLGGVLLITKGCHHNDRRADPGGSRRMDRAQPRHPGHRDIGDDEIEGAVFRQTVDELGAGAGPSDIGSEMREAFGHNVEQFRIVVRDEDARIERHCLGASKPHAREFTRQGAERPSIFCDRVQGIFLAPAESRPHVKQE